MYVTKSKVLIMSFRIADLCLCFLIWEKTTHELCHEKNQQCGFQTGLTETELYQLRIWLEAGKFKIRFRKKGIVLSV